MADTAIQQGTASKPFSSMRYFWLLLLITLVIAVVIALFTLGWIAQSKPPFDGQTIVGLVALAVTLPISLAASIVVIRLGDRMEDLAIQSEARELFVVQSESYRDLYSRLDGLSKVLFEIGDSLRNDVTRLILDLRDLNNNVELKILRENDDFESNKFRSGEEQRKAAFVMGVVQGSKAFREKLLEATGDLLKDYRLHKCNAASPKQRNQYAETLRSLRERDKVRRQGYIALIEDLYDFDKDKPRFRSAVQELSSILRLADDRQQQGGKQWDIDGLYPPNRLIEIATEHLLSDDRTKRKAAFLRIFSYMIFPYLLAQPELEYVEDGEDEDGPRLLEKSPEKADWEHYFNLDTSLIGLKALKELINHWPTKQDLIDVATVSTNIKSVDHIVQQMLSGMVCPKVLVSWLDDFITPQQA